MSEKIMLMIKVGYDSAEDMKKVYSNPKKYGEPGLHTIYLNSEKDLPHILTKKGMELASYRSTKGLK